MADPREDAGTSAVASVGTGELGELIDDIGHEEPLFSYPAGFDEETGWALEELLAPALDAAEK